VLQNNYLDTLRSASIHWSINGEEQPVKSWSGKLAVGKDEAVVIGSFDFEAGKEFMLKAWVSNPNGEQDNLAINDTISTDKFSSGLIGVYTIGGLDADYPNFTKATEALNNWGVVGE